MRLILLLVLVAVRTFLCKALSLGLLLLLLYAKGRRLRFRPESWDAFFKALSRNAVRGWAVAVYGAASLAATGGLYLALRILHFRYGAEVCVSVFLCSLVLTVLRWRRSEAVGQLGEMLRELGVRPPAPREPEP